MPLNTNEPYHRVLSETSQMQESACPLIPLLRGTQDDQIPGDPMKNGNHQRLAVGGDGEFVFNEYRVLFVSTLSLQGRLVKTVTD